MNWNDISNIFPLALFIAIPAFCVWLVMTDNSNRWTTSIFALILVSLGRYFEGHWRIQIGGFSESPWLVELIEGALTWITTAWFIRIIYQLIHKFAPNSKSTHN